MEQHEEDFPDLDPQVTDLPFKEGADPYSDEQVLEDFGDLDQFVAPEPKRLPYHGEVYDFPPDVTARSWLLLQKVRREGQRAGLAEKRGEEYDGDAIIMSDEDEKYLHDDIMGDAYDLLVEDGVPGRVIEKMFSTLMIWHLSGRDFAIKMWKGEVSAGEAAARGNREQRRAAQRQQQRRRASGRAAR